MFFYYYYSHSLVISLLVPPSLTERFHRSPTDRLWHEPDERSWCETLHVSAEKRNESHSYADLRLRLRLALTDSIINSDVLLMSADNPVLHSGPTSNLLVSLNKSGVAAVHGKRKKGIFLRGPDAFLQTDFGRERKIEMN